MRRIFSFIVYRLFLAVVPKVTYVFSGDDAERMEKWLAGNDQVSGFAAYFKSREYSIMKMMGAGTDRETYLELVGRRKELLQLASEMRLAKEREDKAKRK